MSRSRKGTGESCGGTASASGLAVWVALSAIGPGAWAAVNGDLATLQAAVNSAPRGAMVVCAPGSWTWTGTLLITQGISLQGAGAGQTTLTGNSTLVEIQPDATAIANDETIRISGFTFDGNNTAPELMGVAGAPAAGTKSFKNLVIGNNRFQNTLDGAGDGTLYVTGQVRGVIFGNTFDRCDIILRAMGSDSTPEWSNPAYNQVSFGSADNLYFEDNTILYSSAYAGGNPGWIESGQGGRVVGRFNTWDFANAAASSEIWDIHGFQNWDGTPDSGQTGTMIVEYYGNTLKNADHKYRWIDHRGGWGMFFNNVLTGAGGNGIDIYGMSGPASCPSDISPTPTNYDPLVNHSYFWNNTKNGTNVLASPDGGVPGMHCSVAENANWWNLDAACTAASCLAGVGQGASAPTGTCATGVGYWVTGQGEWNSSHPGPDGAFYRCTAPNTWALYYTPYPYPHPLRSTGGPAGTPTPGGTAGAWQAKVYPNPWRAGQQGNQQIIFDPVPTNGTVKIYNAAGERAAVLLAENGRAAWRMNQGSREPASGVYLYIITSPDGQKQIGKLAIVR